MASSSDKSSGVVSTSSPSTPQADSTSIHMEARRSHSLLTESTPSADHLSETKHNQEVFESDDNYLEEETQLVWHKEFPCIFSNFSCISLVMKIEDCSTLFRVLSE